MITEITSHWPMSVGLAGLYLILLSVVKITENLVDMDTRMDQGVLGIGHGLAYSYYYGFLKIILPASETSKCKNPLIKSVFIFLRGKQMLKSSLHYYRKVSGIELCTLNLKKRSHWLPKSC